MIESLHEIPVMLDGAGQAVSQGSYRTAFEAISHDLEEQHDVMFQEGREATGQPWAPLSPVTIKRKGHGIVLIHFGDLYQSLIQQTEDAIREVEDQSLTWGTSDRKARFHQDGTRRMPARPPVGVSEETLDLAAQRIGDASLSLMMGAIDARIN